jgi:hypothetical protein
LPHAEVAVYFNHFARLLIGTCKMLPLIKRQFVAELWPPGMGLLHAVNLHNSIFILFCGGSLHVFSLWLFFN